MDAEINICYRSRFILVVHILMDKYVHAHVVYVEQWCASAPYMTRAGCAEAFPPYSCIRRTMVRKRTLHDLAHSIKYLLLFRVRAFSRAGCAEAFPPYSCTAVTQVELWYRYASEFEQLMRRDFHPLD